MERFARGVDRIILFVLKMSLEVQGYEGLLSVLKVSIGLFQLSYLNRTSDVFDHRITQGQNEVLLRNSLSITLLTRNLINSQVLEVPQKIVLSCCEEAIEFNLDIKVYTR